MAVSSGDCHHDQCRRERQRSPARPDYRGLGTGTNGILFPRAGTSPSKTASSGFFPLPGSLSRPALRAASRCRIRLLPITAEFGILIQPTGSAVVTGVLSNVMANNNGSTVSLVDGAETTGASLNVTIADSEASNNSQHRRPGDLVARPRGHRRHAAQCRCQLQRYRTWRGTRMPLFGSRIRWSPGILLE